MRILFLLFFVVSTAKAVDLDSLFTIEKQFHWSGKNCSQSLEMDPRVPGFTRLTARLELRSSTASGVEVFAFLKDSRRPVGYGSAAQGTAPLDLDRSFLDEFPRAGFGREFKKALIDWAFEGAYETLTDHISPNNEASLRLHLSLGYRPKPYGFGAFFLRRSDRENLLSNEDLNKRMSELTAVIPGRDYVDYLRRLLVQQYVQYPTTGPAVRWITGELRMSVPTFLGLFVNQLTQLSKANGELRSIRHEALSNEEFRDVQVWLARVEILRTFQTRFFSEQMMLLREDREPIELINAWLDQCEFGFQDIPAYAFQRILRPLLRALWWHRHRAVRFVDGMREQSIDSALRN